MSNYKHTPGPWYAVDICGYHRIQDGPYYEDNDLLDYELRGEETAKANATLAAAAPDMLEALYKAEEIIRVLMSNKQTLGTSPGEMAGVHKSMMAAIAKATT